MFKRRQRHLFLHANASNWCHNLLLQMAIFLWNKRIFCQKKVFSDFSYTLTYLTLKYERNRIFHPCRVMFDFYRQALLTVYELAKSYTLPFVCCDKLRTQQTPSQWKSGKTQQSGLTCVQEDQNHGRYYCKNNMKYNILKYHLLRQSNLR